MKTNKSKMKTNKSKLKKKSLKHRLSDDDGKPSKSKDKEKKGKDKEKKGYDPDLDKVIKTIGEVESNSGRGGNILVRILSYDGGAKKLAMQRHGTKKDGSEWFGPLGRITSAECEALIPLMKKGLKRLNRPNRQ